MHGFSALVLGENRPALGLFADLGEASADTAREVELLIELPPQRGMGAQLGRALRAAGAGSLIPARTLAQRMAVSVGSGAGVPLRASEPIRTIVVGVDGGPSGSVALRIASELSAELGGVLHVVSAFNSARGRERAERNAGAGRERRRDPEIRTHALRGDAGDALIAVALSEAAELIVVGDGSTSRGGRFLAGSVSRPGLPPRPLQCADRPRPGRCRSPSLALSTTAAPTCCLYSVLQPPRAEHPARGKSPRRSA